MSDVELDEDVWDAVNRNEEKWGIQHPEELLSAINEEIGEIDQAYLEATHEDGEAVDVHEEILDLLPLLLQFSRSLERHPMAFEPLPTAEETDDGGEQA